MIQEYFTISSCNGCRLTCRNIWCIFLACLLFFPIKKKYILWEYYVSNHSPINFHSHLRRAILFYIKIVNSQQFSRPSCLYQAPRDFNYYTQNALKPFNRKNKITMARPPTRSRRTVRASKLLPYSILNNQLSTRLRLHCNPTVDTVKRNSCKNILQCCAKIIYL